jgi:hypothetical protein
MVDGYEIDFVYLTKIDPVTGWFEIVELPVLERPDASTATDKKEKTRKAKRHLTKIHTLTNIISYDAKLVYDYSICNLVL